MWGVDGAGCLMLVPQGCVWVIYPLSPLVSVALKSIGKVYMSYSLNALKGVI